MPGYAGVDEGYFGGSLTQQIVKLATVLHTLFSKVEFLSHVRVGTLNLGSNLYSGDLG